ncbi:MAG: plasmid pRiA4b ORF-3 family protein [Bacteroidetes bacterium]|nr:plasmid pRiA4b ORF-3 family protein [Bacteroidota bacterium]
MAKVFQIRITLNDVLPEISRTIQVYDDFDLHRLHLVIQYAMGWENSHLYFFEDSENKFEIFDEVYDKASNYDFGVYKVKLKMDKNNWDELFAKMPHMAKYVRTPKKDVDPREKIISELFKNPGDTLSYMYDYGDSWKHTVVLEKIMDPEAGKFYPNCIDAACACPPEDCGGAPGYAHFLEVIANSKHPEYKDMIEWVDGEFNPEKVELSKANAQIKKLFSSKAAQR